MPKFRIENISTSHILGDYEGASEAEALDAYARSAGYPSYGALDAEIPGAELRLTELTDASDVQPGYVRAANGGIYLLLPDFDSQWGFLICDDDQSWDGGFGINEWERLAFDDVPAEARHRLEWILEEHFDRCPDLDTVERFYSDAHTKGFAPVVRGDNGEALLWISRDDAGTYYINDHNCQSRVDRFERVSSLRNEWLRAHE